MQKGANVDLTEAIKRLLALKAVPKADLAYIQENGPKVLQAQKENRRTSGGPGGGSASPARSSSCRSSS